MSNLSEARFSKSREPIISYSNLSRYKVNVSKRRELGMISSLITASSRVFLPDNFKVFGNVGWYRSVYHQGEF